MDDFCNCTDAPGYIFGALDKVFEHAMAAICLVYDVRSSESVRRVDCTDLNVDLNKALFHLEKACQYAGQIRNVQDAVETINHTLDVESREEMEAARKRKEAE